MVPPELVEVALALADAAGAAIRPHFRSGLLADDKSDDSPVTVADRAAEQAMRVILAERCPDHGVIGEEFGTADRGASRYRWVLDPIDGTRAFITGRTTFGVLVALTENGVPVIGIIDQPITGERWIGVAGEPTRFTGPLGGSAGCRACPSLGQAELSATAPDFQPRYRQAGFDRIRAAVRRVTWGGDCYAYGLLALGQIDVIAGADHPGSRWQRYRLGRRAAASRHLARRCSGAGRSRAASRGARGTWLTKPSALRQVPGLSVLLESPHYVLEITEERVCLGGSPGQGA
jgi:histidinol phosphatase-like enzyme (inositol monophosphatase family)